MNYIIAAELFYFLRKSATLLNAYAAKCPSTNHSDPRTDA